MAAHILGVNTAGKKKKKCFPMQSKVQEHKEACELLINERKLNGKAAVAAERNRRKQQKLHDRRLKSGRSVKSSVKATNLTGRLCAITKADVDLAWAQFFLGEGVKTSKVKSGFLANALKNTIRFGPSYVLPTVHDMNGPLLDRECERLKKTVLGPLKKSIVKFGVSLVSDGWSDKRQRPLLNILLFTKKGVYFHKTLNVEGETKDKGFIVKYITEAVEEAPFPNKSILTVVLDGANRFSFDQIQQEMPWLECQWCAAHVLSLLLKDFASLRMFSKVTCSFFTHSFSIFFSHFCVRVWFRCARTLRRQ